MQITPRGKAAGMIAIAIGGVSATLTAETAREWLELAAQYGPLVLSAWLIYVVYSIDKERTELKDQLLELHMKVARLESKQALMDWEIHRDV